MPPRTVIEVGGQKILLLPLENLSRFGVGPITSIPTPAVPFFDHVGNSLTGPMALMNKFDQNLEALGVAGVAKLVGLQAGTPSAGGVEPDNAGDRRVLTYEDKTAFPFTAFRGQRQEGWGLVPSLFRNLPADASSADGEIAARMRRERDAAELIRQEVYRSLGIELTMLQSRAIARHYGIPSGLMDFSFDPRVAAYFGHQPFQTEEKSAVANGKTHIGIIYALDLRRLEATFPMSYIVRAPLGEANINFPILNSKLNIPFRAYDPSSGLSLMNCEVSVPDHMVHRAISVRGVIVPTIGRIKAQQGLFCEIEEAGIKDWRDIVRLWPIVEVLCGKWCFVREDVQFEDDDAGINGEALLPSDPHLDNIIPQLEALRG